MANNRMYLKCTKCSPPEDRILIAKYYPSSNWYFFLGSKVATKIMSGDTPEEMMKKIQADMQDMDDRRNQFDAFFDQHRHEEDNDIDLMWGGKNFALLFET